jgi:hypothetical protein
MSVAILILRLKMADHWCCHSLLGRMAAHWLLRCSPLQVVVLQLVQQERLRLVVQVG